MPMTDAEELDNWIPGENSLGSRLGHESYRALTGVASAEPVETLVPFVSNQGQTQLLAAAGSAIQRVDTSAVSTLTTGHSNAVFDISTFNNEQVWCNGAGVAQTYDGSNFRQAVFTPFFNAMQSPVCSHVFKNRVYYIGKETLGFWYTELFASTGTISYFPLTGIAGKGGYCVAINSWTNDGGDGPDDYLAIFTSEGEVLVYAGSDPGSDFAIVGRFYIGPIINNSTVTQVFGKLFTVTQRDYLFLPDAFQYGGNGRQSKLSGAAADAVRKYKTFPGFNVYYSSARGLLIVNVPLSDSTSEQHVINVKTGSATRFTGINARSWVDYKGELYIGGADGVVYKYTGSKDNGSAIACVGLTAPSVLRRNAEKKLLAYKPRLTSDADVTLVTGLAYDFGETAFTQSITLDGQTGGGVLPLDWPFSWESPEPAKTELLKGAGRGTFVQLYLRADITQKTEWYGNDFVSETGGNLR